MGLGAQQRHAGVKAPAHQFDALARGFDVGCDGGNLRSMAADSELNVATDSMAHTRALRKRVWGMQTGGDREGTGGEGSNEEIAKAFESWQRLASNNKSKTRSGEMFNGFLVQFEDKRTALHRYG